jgi:hypothetical protein
MEATEKRWLLGMLMNLVTVQIPQPLLINTLVAFVP